MSEDVQTASQVDADVEVTEVEAAEAASSDAEVEVPHAEGTEAEATDGERSEQAAEAAEGDEEEPAEGSAPRVSKREESLNNEGEIAADYLEELLDIADLDGDIDTFNESGRAHVSVITDSEVLVGKDGEVLDALQELARLAVMTETGHRSRLMLDIAGYRDKQRRSLQDLAADAISEVESTGEPVRLSPMNPYQRKIVHDAVAAAGLSSESEGEEPRRRVVVLPKG
ncbi:protein jag [Propioniciclava coleopterorum]|uniref:Protein jag n=1 Tax=Propioniciclava coleopterorum TaxID=2714937 RepID=A0A6G7Y5I0_9ACTN|nr:R3H domain-containing nucleic acid-binding protein [Propioniciclava coleopterorum]QIK72144.1 protein jag [Propioniciclava coleopterorum]